LPAEETLTNQDYLRKKADKERNTSIHRKIRMRKEYNFSKMKGRKNPYAAKLKKQVTLRLGVDVIEYFKGLAEDTGIPYQNLINLYLRDCAHSHKKLSLQWAS
jgi:uncharacterized protein (DUF4415 family)